MTNEAEGESRPAPAPDAAADPETAAEPAAEPSRRNAVWRRRAWFAGVAIFLGVGVMAYVFTSRFGQDPRLVDSPLVGQPFPELTLDHLEADGSLRFADLEGEILVVNFWASWCFPCRIEHPALTSASAAYEGRGVHFVGILHQDREGSAVEFLDEFGRGVNYSYVVDPDSRASVEMGVFGIPETFFVDQEGVIRGKVQGEVTAALLVDTLEDLLAGRQLDL